MLHKAAYHRLQPCSAGGDIDEPLAFYGRMFDFQLRGKSKTMAFIDLGDQFIALQAGRKQPTDDGRHVGLVVDDKEAARAALKAAGVEPIGGPFPDFRDPWGNRIEIVGYDNIQFTKAPNVLRGMALAQLTKNESAKKELAEKEMAGSRSENCALDFKHEFRRFELCSGSGTIGIDRSVFSTSAGARRHRHNDQKERQRSTPQWTDFGAGLSPWQARSAPR